MVAIVFDYADIASRVKGDPLIKPKAPVYDPPIPAPTWLPTPPPMPGGQAMPVRTNLPPAKWRLLNQGKLYVPEEDI
jgi:hypothetical protein